MAALPFTKSLSLVFHAVCISVFGVIYEIPILSGKISWKTGYIQQQIKEYLCHEASFGLGRAGHGINHHSLPSARLKTSLDITYRLGGFLL